MHKHLIALAIAAVLLSAAVMASSADYNFYEAK